MLESIAAALAPYPIALVLLGAIVWLAKENRRLRVTYDGDPGDAQTAPKVGRLEALRQEYEGVPGDASKPGRIGLLRAEYEEKLKAKDAKLDQLHKDQIDTLRQLAHYLEEIATAEGSD